MKSVNKAIQDISLAKEESVEFLKFQICHIVVELHLCSKKEYFSIFHQFQMLFLFNFSRTDSTFSYIPLKLDIFLLSRLKIINIDVHYVVIALYFIRNII